MGRDITLEIMNAAGWRSPCDCEVLVYPTLGGPPTRLPVLEGQRLALPIDTRPIRGAEPGAVFDRLELDGVVVWANPARGRVRVEMNS